MGNINTGFADFRNTKLNVTFTSVDSDAIVVDNESIQNDIVSLTTNKSINNPEGTFSISLIARDNISNYFSTLSPKKSIDYYSFFSPAGLVDIRINDSAVMLGMIDSVTRRSVMQNNKPMQRIIISGRDLGMMLTTQKIWYDIIATDDIEIRNTGINADKMIFGVMKDNKHANIMEQIVTTWLFEVLNNIRQGDVFTFADGVGIDSRLICKGQPLGALSRDSYVDLYPCSFGMMAMQQTLWNYLQQLSSPPFSELYFDTGGCSVALSKSEGTIRLKSGAGYVIFRPSPYDDTDISPAFETDSKLSMQDLPVNYIDDPMILEKQLSRTSANTFNYFFSMPQNFAVSESFQKVFAPPIRATKKIRRYGYRPLEVPLQGYNFIDGGAVENFMALSTRYNERLRYWFENTDQLLTGSFNIKGNEKIRIGQRLDYIRDENNRIENEYEEGHYYITDVSHRYDYGSPFTTSLKVNRGFSKKLFSKRLIS